MRVSVLLVLLFFFYRGDFIKAQDYSYIEGVVLNNRTAEPIPNVNIIIKGTGCGTTTNFEGKFIFEYPSELKNKVLEISHVGMKTVCFPVNTIYSSLFMFLEQRFEKINEVYVMPDEIMETYLQDAWGRIKKNYCRTPSSLTGIYRESLNAFDSIPLYYAEAMTEFYKPGVNKRREVGQARIIKSRKRFFPAHDSLNHILFHGGIYLPSEMDVVKNRLPFINPKHKSDYYYRIDNMFTRNGREIVVIRFDNDNGRLPGLYEGVIYLDRDTYAYLEFDYSLTKQGVDELNFYENNPYHRECVRYRVKYKLHDKKYHLYYATKEGESNNETFKTPLKYRNEYVTIDVKVDNAKPIPDMEVFSSDRVFSMAAQDYNEKNWYDFNFLEANFDFKLDSLKKTKK
jgi:hypothetical protein